MKRRIKKRVLLIFVIFIIFGFIIYFTTSNNKEKLKHIGYSQLEINEIEKLTKSEINTITKYKYNKNLIYIIKSNDYNPNKLDLYIKYIFNNKDINYLKIFKLINNDDFKKNKISEYVSLLRKYDNVNGIVNYVNNYSDKNIHVNSTALALIEQKYFIFEYFDRYVNYYKDNSKLSYNEIVARVNSNLDNKFYTDSNKADITKGMYTLVNKYNYLENNYVPNDIISAEKEYTTYNAKLNKTAYENFVKLADAARKDNLYLKITTGYRDYNFQSTLYNNYVKIDGVKGADTYSARPGYSEHQLGYSVDLTNNSNASFDEFKNTKEYEWLQKNAYKYGFILRFPKDKEYITGYNYEAWHYRYVGKKISDYIFKNNITYEEYYAYFLR